MANGSFAWKQRKVSGGTFFFLKSYPSWVGCLHGNKGRFQGGHFFFKELSFVGGLFEWKQRKVSGGTFSLKGLSFVGGLFAWKYEGKVRKKKALS